MSTTGDTGGYEVTLSGDPTETKTHRKNWIRDYNGRWRDVRGAMRTALLSGDLAGARDAPPARAASEFRRYLRRQMEDTVLGNANTRAVERGRHWTAGRIRDAYRTGIRLAGRYLLRAGASDPQIAEATNERHDSHQELRQELFVATVHDTEDAVHATLTDATRTFRDGVARGDPKRELASAVNGRIDAVGQTRTQTIAATKTVEAVNRAALTAYEIAGVEEVTAAPETLPVSQRENAHPDDHQHSHPPDRVKTNAPSGAGEVQFVTAGDRRVCAECRTLGGGVYSIQQLKENPDSLRPPIHPNCRCMLLPLAMESSGEEIEAGPLMR